MTASAAQVAAHSGAAIAANEPTTPPTVHNPGVASGGATAARAAAPPAPRKSSPARPAPATTIRCPRCTKPADSGLPFCGYCGTRIAPAGAGMCAQCGASFLQGVDLFCARCGNRVGQRVSVEVVRGGVPVSPGGGSATQGMLASRREAQPRLALLDDEGSVARAYILERGEAIVGRGDADIRFESD